MKPHLKSRRINGRDTNMNPNTSMGTASSNGTPRHEMGGGSVVSREPRLHSSLSKTPEPQQQQENHHTKHRRDPDRPASTRFQ